MRDTFLPRRARLIPTVVVFDVGGVLLDWDPRYLYRTIFADGDEMERFLADVCSPEWNFAQDKGRPWPVGEAEAIARHPHYAVEIRAYRARWHEMIPAAIAGTVTILERLAQGGVPLFAITNFASDTFREACARFAFFAHFRGIVVSGDLGILKPDPAIYHRLARDHGLDLTQCLFIDDVERNVMAARTAGMAGVQFSTPVKLAGDLRAFGFDI